MCTYEYICIQIFTERKLFDCGFATVKNDEDLNSIDNTFNASDNNDNITVNIVPELVTTKGEETPTSLVVIDDERPPPAVLSPDMHLAPHRDEETGQISDLRTSKISPVLDLVCDSIVCTTCTYIGSYVHMSLCVQSDLFTTSPLVVLPYTSIQ